MNKLPRDDLALTAYAVVNGFTLHNLHGDGVPLFHVDGIPPDPITFRKGHVSVWLTSRGWRVARRGSDGKMAHPKDNDFHKKLFEALEAAGLIIVIDGLA